MVIRRMVYYCYTNNSRIQRFHAFHHGPCGCHPTSGIAVSAARAAAAGAAGGAGGAAGAALPARMPDSYPLGNVGITCRKSKNIIENHGKS